MRAKQNRHRILSTDLAEIELTQGFWALVDIEDLARLLQYAWYVRPGRNTYYAHSTQRGGKHRIAMHSFIMGHIGVDHVNGDGLDNRKSNLRIATNQQNVAASRTTFGHNTSGYRGVSRFRQGWRASVVKDRKQYFKIGFATSEEAASWYNAKAKELFGEFAYQNDIPPPKIEQH